MFDTESIVVCYVVVQIRIGYVCTNDLYGIYVNDAIKLLLSPLLTSGRYVECVCIHVSVWIYWLDTIELSDLL